MSDSRLEKFIYAICSMDVSDLPVPLSRIEKLWNCLITGETPDFEPLSRNEKYLMAMLDRYDISNLPAPMSRGEKLLYKIAVGETDLSDVPGYLSRYEELLKYLIENGGISGGDFEYVLYTLNQSLYTLYMTAEKPVKSAILKGQTLVNVIDEIWFPSSDNYYFHVDLKQYEINKDYLFVMFNAPIEITQIYFGNAAASVVWSDYTSDFVRNGSTISFKVTCPSNYDGDTIFPHFRFGSSEPSLDELKQMKAMLIPYQEGMENWDIPYFEGMQSVKMPVLTTVGKNLYNKEIHQLAAILGANKELYYGTDYIPVLSNTTYTKSNNTRYELYDINKTLLKGANSSTIKTTSDTRYIRYNVLKTEIDTHQLEQGSTTTTYEPYNSTTLSTPSDLELRKVGEVQDTLDCLTGELTQRIGKIILDGTQSSVTYSSQYSNDDYYSFIFNMTNDGFEKAPSAPIGISCPIPFQQNIMFPWTTAKEYVLIGSDGNTLIIKLLKSKLNNDNSISSLNTYLASNPITINYPLKTESVKTVDLTVVNQDNQPTQLGTFENVTHVSLEAENLIPEVEMEVATNLLEDTVFNLTSAFNTLYPTAEKPVKSAILKGKSEVVVGKNKCDTNKAIYSWIDGINGLDTNISEGSYVPVEVSGTITISNYISDNIRFVYQYDANGNYLGRTEIGVDVITLALAKNTALIKIGFFRKDIDYIKSLQLQVEQGTTATEYEPYNPTLVSVKMPVLKSVGKNTFNIKNKGAWRSGWYSIPLESPFNGEVYVKGDNSLPSDFRVNILAINKNEHTLTNDSVKGGHTCYYQNLTDIEFHCPSLSIEGNSRGSLDDLIVNGYIVIELGGEPYKSNILSCNEEVALRGIGEVQDTLDCLTGEVTEHIGEVVLDGSEKWSTEQYYSTENHIAFSLVHTFFSENNRPLSTYQLPLCNKLNALIESEWTKDVEGIFIGGKATVIRVPKDKIDGLIKFKEYLSQNPITIQYRLATESIKTVDLTVVDQDGNETELRTFDDTTHLVLNSEGLIPTASLTVRTKIPSASSTSLLMDELSVEQQQLETTVDEQSNNVDATMIATTEIFEETL